MNYFGIVGIVIIISAATTASLAAPVEAAQLSNVTGNVTAQSLDASKITTSWNLSFLYKDKDAARAEISEAEHDNRTDQPDLPTKVQ